MDIIEKYIYAVTRRLPAEQRDDIEKELRGLIEDMLSDRQGSSEPSAEDLDAVLIALGNPALLADQYRSRKKYLIGPVIFDTYLLVLKIVLAVSVFGVTLAEAIKYTFITPSGITNIITGYIDTIFSVAMMVFAWITLLFVLIDHFGIDIKADVAHKKWTPADLPEIPLKETIIKPFESIFGIVVAILALIIFNSAEHLIGIYYIDGEGLRQITPLFNTNIFPTVLPLINIILFITISRELVKLAVGRWTKKLALANLVSNALIFTLMAIFITTNSLWNPGFFAFLLESGFIPEGIEMLSIWNSIIYGFLFLLALIFIIDSISSLIKGFKYNAI